MESDAELLNLVEAAEHRIKLREAGFTKADEGILFDVGFLRRILPLVRQGVDIQPKPHSQPKGEERSMRCVL